MILKCHWLNLEEIQVEEREMVSLFRYHGWQWDIQVEIFERGWKCQIHRPTILGSFIFQKTFLHNPPRKYDRRRKVTYSLSRNFHHIVDFACTVYYFVVSKLCNTLLPPFKNFWHMPSVLLLWSLCCFDGKVFLNGRPFEIEVIRSHQNRPHGGFSYRCGCCQNWKGKHDSEHAGSIL